MANQKSDSIRNYEPRWKLVRDLTEGSYKVKLAGLEYLPVVSVDQGEEAYELYKQEVTFYPATERTLSGLHGLVFVKKPVLEAPDNIVKIAEAASYEGQSIEDIAEWAMRETLSVTYGAMLVDYPSGPAPTNRLDADRSNFRPRIACYPAENVVRVERAYSFFHNAKILSFVELIEDSKTNRVFKLVNGVYTVETWVGDESGYRLVNSVTPTRNGETLNEMPIEILSDEAGAVDPRKPMLEDVAQLNLDHYRCEGRITYIHYWQSMAILWAAGVDTVSNEPLKDSNGIIMTDNAGQPMYEGQFKVGGPDAWMISDAQAKVSYAEFSGEGVMSLERKRAAIEDRIAKVGAQVLGSEKKDAEAVEVVAMRREAQSSTLAAVARVVSRKITNLLQWIEWWEGADENSLKSSFKLNTDYRVADMSPQLLAALAGDNQRGQLSDESYFYLRQRGGVIDETLSWEEELERREQDALRVPPNDFAPEETGEDEG